MFVAEGPEASDGTFLLAACVAPYNQYANETQ